MRFRATIPLLAAAGVAAAGLAVAAQQTTEIHPGRGGSPHVRTDWTVAGANISVEYGRPYLKGRPLSQLTPPGRVWRTGADEATTLKTDKDLEIGGTHVPAGTYTLFTIPGADRWTLIVNRQTGQWGTQYDQEQDLARIDMKAEQTAEAVEQLTISIEPKDDGGELRVEWGNTRASVPFSVKS